MTPHSGINGAPFRIGQLLVATPTLFDTNFARTVVLLCEVAEDGITGLVLNQASLAPVSEYLPEWEATEPAVVFVGGPVQPEIAVGLMKHSGHDPIGFTEIGAAVGLFDLATPVELVSGAVDRLRVFSGYAGWGVGQLLQEINVGDWIVVDAVESDHFTADPETLWSEVLRRQGGDVALLADFPIDPTLN